MHQSDLAEVSGDLTQNLGVQTIVKYWLYNTQCTNISITLSLNWPKSLLHYEPQALLGGPILQVFSDIRDQVQILTLSDSDE